jgi:hypothetical protein
MNGKINHFFISHHTYLTYDVNSSTFKVILNMFNLQEQNTAPMPGAEVTYNTNFEDSSYLVFEGSVPESKIRPKESLKDTYTFSVVGNIKYRQFNYPTQIVCSYGARMIRNSSQIALNVDIEVLKMDDPMYIPLIKEMIDNLKIRVVDGTVNMVQN